MYSTVGRLPSRSALPSASETRTIGISNMCAPVANVPSFIVTNTD